MGRADSLELISQALFDTEKRQSLSPADAELLERVRDAYTFWLEKPTMTDTNIRDYLMANHCISRSQAYNDIAIIKAVLGNVPTASKEFYRYKANHILDQAHAAAIAGNDAKAKALTKIAEAIAYNNRTYDDDGEKMPFNEIVPKDLSFTLDPSAAGIKPVDGLREKSKRLFEKYKEEIELDTTAYVEYEEDIL